jgi:ketosteroid isomerase-like protein
MKNTLILLLISLCLIETSAQGIRTSKTDLQKLVETEQAFARTAAEKGTKTAFLTYLADDGIIFNPTEANGKLVWKARADSPALLSWNPAWADISSDGKLGFTTGGWEFRPKGKTDKPVGFGEYVTIWQKQPDGSFKAVLDIGISHPASSVSAAAWRAPTDAGTGAKAVQNGVDNATLTDIFSNKSIANGYFNYLAEDAVVLRDGYAPFYGKRNAFFALERLEKEFPASAFLTFSGNTSKIFGNMMYVWGVYQLNDKDKSLKKWNFVQIWKNRAGKWQLVLDIFNPVKAPQK